MCVLIDEIRAESILSLLTVQKSRMGCGRAPRSGASRSPVRAGQDEGGRRTPRGGHEAGAESGPDEANGGVRGPPEGRRGPPLESDAERAEGRREPPRGGRESPGSRMHRERGRKAMRAVWGRLGRRIGTCAIRPRYGRGRAGSNTERGEDGRCGGFRAGRERYQASRGALHVEI